MRNPVLPLRVSAILTFIHAVLHTIGGVFGKPLPGPAAVAAQAMQVNQFPLMGHLRSYADFYRGLGLGATITMTAEAVVFWQLSNLAKTDPTRLRPMLLTFLVAYSVLAVNSYTYFFMGPVIVELLIAGCLGWAAAVAQSDAPSRQFTGLPPSRARAS